MAIYSGSRYETVTVDYFTKEESGRSYPIVFYPIGALNQISYVTHIYTPGETLHYLSQKYFKRPDLWWTIVEYNPEITDFFNIPSGTLLRIPSV